MNRIESVRVSTMLPPLRKCYRHVKSLMSEAIQAIWTKFSQAYYEPRKVVLKIKMPLHPQKNIYPKRYKVYPWPHYLDQARGTFATCTATNIEAMAQKMEPLEKVTPLHAVVYKEKNIIQQFVSRFYGQESDEVRISRLIANGANIDAEDIRGQTPVYWAAYFGNLSALIRLKIYGADLNKKDHRGKTPLRAAVKYGHQKVIDFLASHHVNLNVRDGRGLTPLHLAAYLGRVNICEELICAGADRTLLDPSGYTAEEILKLRFAEKYHNYSFIRRLFSSPRPPSFSLKPFNIEKLTDIRAGEVVNTYFRNFEGLAKAEQWNEILVQGKGALELAKVLNREQDEAKICAQLTSSSFYLGDYDQALKYAERCHELAKAFVDPSLFIRALYLESASYRALAQKNEDEQTQQTTFCRAVDIAENAITLYLGNKVNNLALYGKLHFNLGAAHADNPKGNLEKARECYLKAVACFSSMQAHEDVIRTNIRLAKVLHLQGNNIEALQVVEKLRPSITKERLAMHTDYLEAQILLALRKFTEALVVANSGMMKAKKLHAKEDEVRLGMLIARLETIAEV